MDEYEIQKSIGIGSFGQVFLAKHRPTSRSFVVKKLKVKDLNPKDRENIETEIQCLRDFKHVNIVSYRDSFIDAAGVLNIVMQYCEEGDMYSKIRGTQGRRFDETQVLDWTVQMCLAIYYMHERRILHRDLKTQNIFLTNGKVKLGDFGISKVLDSTVQLTSTVIGTPYYMSPEQFKYKPYSYKTDIWALGCVIYEMCSLRHAFDAQSMNALAVKVLKGNYAKLSDNYSKGLQDLVKKMLSVNPKDRPTVVQVLKTPVLRRRLVSYMQGCLKEPAGEYNHIESLLEQAQKLGVPLTEEGIPSNPSHYSSQPNSIPNSVSATEVLRSNSKDKEQQRGIARSESQERIHQRRNASKDDHKRRERSMIEDDSRRHQEEKKSEERKMIERRNELLEREREKRKRLASQERMRRNESSEKKLQREQSLPLLCDSDSRRKIEAPVSVPLVNRPKTKLPEISSSSGGIPPPPVNYVQTPQPQSVHVEPVTPKVVYPSVEVHQIPTKKPFRMEEEYDMDFEEEEEEEYAPVIEEHNEDDDVELPEKQLLTEKQVLVIEKEPPKAKAEKYEAIEKPTPLPVVSVSEKKIEPRYMPEVRVKAGVKEQKERSNTNILKSQASTNVVSMSSNNLFKANDVLIKPKDEKRVSSAALFDSDSPNRNVLPTRTELEYSNSSCEDKTAKAVRVISKPAVPEVQSPTNEKYLRIQKRIQGLRSSTEAALGPKIFSDLYNLIRNNSQSGQQTLRSRVLTIIEERQIGYWHFLDQIIELEGVLKQIPPRAAY